jgi:hypothetical protein
VSGKYFSLTRGFLISNSQVRNNLKAIAGGHYLQKESGGVHYILKEIMRGTLPSEGNSGW